jgi:hypothetical protein
MKSCCSWPPAFSFLAQILSRRASAAADRRRSQAARSVRRTLLRRRLFAAALSARSAGRLASRVLPTAAACRSRREDTSRYASLPAPAR